MIDTILKENIYDGVCFLTYHIHSQGSLVNVVGGMAQWVVRLTSDRWIPVRNKKLSLIA